jgi:hypothetical protein
LPLQRILGGGSQEWCEIERGGVREEDLDWRNLEEKQHERRRSVKLIGEKTMRSMFDSEVADDGSAFEYFQILWEEFLKNNYKS